MWRTEAGEGYIEGTIFAAAAVITSVAPLKLLSPIPAAKTVTQKHTMKQREEKNRISHILLQTHKTDL